MRGANMSVVGRAVVKCFVTGGTGKRVFCNALVMRFEMSIKACLLGGTFVTASAFVRFLTVVDALMSL